MRCVGSPGGSQGINNPPAMQETQAQSLGGEDPLGKRNDHSVQYSCLGNLMDRGAWRGYGPWGSQRLRHDWATNSLTFCVICVGLLHFTLEWSGMAIWHLPHPGVTWAQRHTHTVNRVCAWPCPLQPVVLQFTPQHPPTHQLLSPLSPIAPDPSKPIFPPYQPLLSLPFHASQNGCDPKVYKK